LRLSRGPNSEIAQRSVGENRNVHGISNHPAPRRELAGAVSTGRIKVSDASAGDRIAGRSGVHSAAWYLQRYVLHREGCVEHLRGGGKAGSGHAAGKKSKGQPKIGSHEFLRDLNNGRKACLVEEDHPARLLWSGYDSDERCGATG